MPTLLQEVESVVTHALGAAFPACADQAPLVTPATDSKFGDYQCNVAMTLKKRLPDRNPRDIAQAIVAQLNHSTMVDTPEIAGPGFINMRLKSDYLNARLSSAFLDERLGVERVCPPRTYVIDFCNGCSVLLATMLSPTIIWETGAPSLALSSTGTSTLSTQRPTPRIPLKSLCACTSKQAWRQLRTRQFEKQRGKSW
jgi:hypothetical protein